MLRRLELEQFKNLRHASLSLGPLRVLVGANASGKSSFFEALRLVQEACLVDVPAALARHGGFEPLLHQGQSGGPKFIINLQFVARPGSRAFYEYSFEVGREERRVGLYEERLKRVGADGVARDLFYARWGQSKYGELQFDTSEYGVPALKWLASIKGQKEIREVIGWIRNWRFLAVDVNQVRMPQRDEPAALLDVDGGNLAKVLHTLVADRAPVFGRIVEDLRLLLRQVDDLHLGESDGVVSLLLKEHGRRLPFDPRALSDGTLRLLAILTALHTMPEHGLLCIEEPEHGLHPHLLGQLLGLIREVCPPTGTRQVLLTTHSADLVDAARPDEIVPVERDESGATVVRPPDREDLDRWLKDFRLGELWRMRQIGGVP